MKENNSKSDSKQQNVCRIRIAVRGPYMVFGMPPLAQQFIMPDSDGESWYFQQGRSFDMVREPVALCRCGASANKPYCDGSHLKVEWDSELRASLNRNPAETRITEGAEVTLSDDREYCVFSRFCYARGGVRNLVRDSANQTSRKLAVREAAMCPGGRLSIRENLSGRDFEFAYPPSLGLIEDPVSGVSGGLWVRGGIPVERPDGATYEIRNRTVLCRCGESSNKPFCDGSHVAARFRDSIEGEASGQTVPETVY